AFLLFGSLPHHTGKALELHQGLASVGPVLQLLDRYIIEQSTAERARAKHTRNIHHVRGAWAFVVNRRAASRTETAHRFRGRVLVPRNGARTAGDPKTLAPAPDIGRVGCAMGPPARRRMIMPCPARGDIDLEANASAQAFAGC